MRRLLCAECGSKYKPGRYCLLPATDAEPAEWARVVKGSARTPTQGQMTIWVDGQAELLDPTTYLCDHCMESVCPGDPAVAVSIWIEGTYGPDEPGPWEHDYISD